jgi:hypothetical protein
MQTLMPPEMKILLHHILHPDWSDGVVEVALRKDKMWAHVLRSVVPESIGGPGEREDVQRDGDDIAAWKWSLKIDPKATYVISGGVSGFGLVMAVWLARRGARKLLLLSRSGKPKTTQETAMLERMHRAGVQVETPKVDITDASSVIHAASAMLHSGRLGGVMHTVTVYEDERVEAMSWESWMRVA